MEKVIPKQRRGNYFLNELPKIDPVQEKVVVPVQKKENEWVKTARIIFRWKSLVKILRVFYRITGLKFITKSIGKLTGNFQAKLSSSLSSFSDKARSSYLDFAEDFFTYQDKFSAVPLEITNRNEVKIKEPGPLEMVLSPEDIQKIRATAITAFVSLAIILMSLLRPVYAAKVEHHSQLISDYERISLDACSFHSNENQNGMEGYKPITKKLVQTSYSQEIDIAHFNSGFNYRTFKEKGMPIFFI